MRRMFETETMAAWLSRTAMMLAAGVLSFSMLAGVSGCETTEGVGEDVEAAGEGIQDTVD